MIIHQPEIIKDNGNVILAAHIEKSIGVPYFPEFIWYRLPERFDGAFTTQADAFLAASILTAMERGEDIEVRGPISPRLAYFIEEYMALMLVRMPQQLNRINVDIRKIEALPSRPNGVGTTFTGGSDSLYTIQQHLPQNQPLEEFQLSHAVFIHGFDLLPSEEHHYQHLLHIFQPQAQEIGIELLPLQTNMVSMRAGYEDLPYMFGPLIDSAALALSGLFGCFYVPSSWTFETVQRTPHTSDSLADRLLSTDTLDIIHHGSSKERVEKVEALSGWEPAHDIFWVCSEQGFSENHINCGKCEKCVRTMIPLYALGKMDAFTTFARPLRKDSDVFRYWRKFNLRSNYVSEMFAFLREHKPSTLPWLVLATIFGWLRYQFIQYLPGFIKRFLNRYGMFISRYEGMEIYEVPEITELLRAKLRR